MVKIKKTKTEYTADSVNTSQPTEERQKTRDTYNVSSGGFAILGIPQGYVVRWSAPSKTGLRFGRGWEIVQTFASSNAKPNSKGEELGKTIEVIGLLADKASGRWINTDNQILLIIEEQRAKQIRLQFALNAQKMMGKVNEDGITEGAVNSIAQINALQRKLAD